MQPIDVDLKVSSIPTKLKIICALTVFPIILIGGLNWFVLPEFVAVFTKGQLTFSACLLSFLGATHWGIIIRSLNGEGRKVTWGRMLWSFTPVAVAWITLFLAPKDACIILIVGVIATYAADRVVALKNEITHSYLMLRAYHSFGIVIGLGLTLVYQMVHFP